MGEFFFFFFFFSFFVCGLIFKYMNFKKQFFSSFWGTKF